MSQVPRLIVMRIVPRSTCVLSRPNDAVRQTRHRRRRLWGRQAGYGLVLYPAPFTAVNCPTALHIVDTTAYPPLLAIKLGSTCVPYWAFWYVFLSPANHDSELQDAHAMQAFPTAEFRCCDSARSGVGGGRGR